MKTMNQEQVKKWLSDRKRSPKRDIDIFWEENYEKIQQDYVESLASNGEAGDSDYHMDIEVPIQYSTELCNDVMMDIYMEYIADRTILSALNGYTGISA